jgi:hypothetical protein
MSSVVSERAALVVGAGGRRRATRPPFDPDGHLKDEAVASQLRKLCAEVVRAARQFQADGACDYAEGTGIGPEVGVDR